MKSLLARLATVALQWQHALTGSGPVAIFVGTLFATVVLVDPHHPLAMETACPAEAVDVSGCEAPKNFERLNMDEADNVMLARSERRFRRVGRREFTPHQRSQSEVRGDRRNEVFAAARLERLNVPGS